MDQLRALPVDLEFADWQELLAILAARAPDRDVWVFGSRSAGRAKQYSDLDLAFGGTSPMSLDDRAQLAEDFENSDLPFRVDLVDLVTAEPTFGARVRSSGVQIQRRS